MKRKEFNINSKADWMEAVVAVVYAIQKTRSIKVENNDDPMGLNPEQLRIRDYILGIGKKDRLAGYLTAFVKMQEKGDKIEPTDAYNLSIFANMLYPDIGILALTGSEVNIPELQIPPKWGKQ